MYMYLNNEFDSYVCSSTFPIFLLGLGMVRAGKHLTGIGSLEDRQ